MITHKKALNKVLSQKPDYGFEEIDLLNSPGRTLAEPISADRAFPPFDRVMMDGFAFNFEAIQQGQQQFKIEGEQPAGAPQKKLATSEHCIEVMTGAVLPKGTDTVIPYEDCSIKEGKTIIPKSEIKKNQFIHHKGSDKKAGTTLLKQGKQITTADIGIMATVGKSRVLVRSVPKISVISTGDELVEINQKPKTHQIRRSNVYTIQAALRYNGFESTAFHLMDDADQAKKEVENVLKNFDIVILSGGVSKGKRDFLPEVFETLGVKKILHGVKQKPGKPFWFGKSKENRLIFGLPGNPVSTYVCYHIYFKSWLNQIQGIERQHYHARLMADINFKLDKTYFVPVHLAQNSRGEFIAHPLEGSGSGDLANLSKSNGLIKFSREREYFKRGEIYKVIYT